MNKKLFLFSLTFAAVIQVTAQRTLFDVLDPTKSNNTSLLSKSGKPVEGNPNLFDDFMNGRVFYGEQKTAAQVNLDLYNKKLLVKIENTNYIANAAAIKKIEVQVADDSIAVFKFISSTFMQVLYEDSAHAVYIRYSVKIKKGTPGNGYEAAKNDSFDLIKEYELVKPYSFTFSDSKDLVKKLNKLAGTSKEDISSILKFKGRDKDRIIFVVKNL
jgi:hypothetical protein